MKKYYRIVRDEWDGYEVQRWRWWFPFWLQCCEHGYISNTHMSVEEAEEFIERHSKPVIKNVTIE